MGRRSLLEQLEQNDEDDARGSSRPHSNQQKEEKSQLLIPTSTKGKGWRNDSETPLFDSIPLLNMLRPNPKSGCKPDQLSPSALAYIGDNVFELFVRNRYIWPTRKMSDLQDVAVRIVRAEFQAQLLAHLVAVLPLSTKEKQILSRGRNAGGKANRGATYQDATALEALLGYAYLSDPDRCAVMLQVISSELDCDDKL